MSLLADAAPPVEATPSGRIDAEVERLTAGAAGWSELGPAQRARVLRRCIKTTHAVAAEWVRAAVAHKGPLAVDALAGEEWLSGPASVLRGLRLYADALEAGGRPRPRGISLHPSGRSVARVFPGSLIDSLVYFGAESEIWIRPGEQPTQGATYRRSGDDSRPAGVAAVLGAGNIASIGPLDTLHKLVVDDETVALKLNPVNDYLGPIFERALAPLVESGLLSVVHGGAEVGGVLCEHPGVRAIHLTGSHHTHDAIVWGSTAEERERRKRLGEPRIDKRVTSELGCVTPVLVCPGDWSDRELDYHAEQIASTVAHNASFNCNAGKVVVLASGWSQRATFLDRLRAALRVAAPRRAYYPGAAERYSEMLRHYPAAERLGQDGAGVVPWTLIPDVPPRAEEYALSNEAFCGVIAEVTIEAGSPAEFLERAVPFVNEQVWGELSCSLIVDDAARRTDEVAVERAIAGLAYGNVTVNAWPGIAFYLGSPSWGAYPGNRLEDVRSGIGWVHNTHLFDHPEKSVVRAPFRIWPKPPWFASHRTMARLGPAMADLEAGGGSLTLMRLGRAALSG